MTSLQAVVGSTTSKLRDSCHACAVSKVKCQKEKPTCSRCARRGITCEYFITKRPGRKREKSQSSSNDKNSAMVEKLLALHGSNSHSTTIGLSPASFRPSSVTSTSPTDIFSGLSMPLEPNLTPLLDGSNDMFDDFFASPIELDFTDMIDDTSGPASDIASADRRNVQESASPSSNSQALLNGSTSASSTSDSFFCCLMHALSLMRKLSSTKSSVCTLSSGIDDVNTGTNFNFEENFSAQNVVMENEYTIEAISNILQCSCADDSYLLVTLSMVVFKILERYATIARRDFERTVEEGRISSGIIPIQEQVGHINKHSLGEGNLGRLVAQSILGELHRVQRLVNQLSPRLKICKGEDGDGGDGSGILQLKRPRIESQSSSATDDGSLAAPFSATVLGQLEIDLRKALSSLSSEIIDMLRRS